MYRYYIAIMIALMFSGCSNITFNASMCEKIASDPNAVIPEECRNYNKEEAQKAFDNTKHKQKQNNEDVVEFNK